MSAELIISADEDQCGPVIYVKPGQHGIRITTQYGAVHMTFKQWQTLLRLGVQWLPEMSDGS